MGQWEFRAMTCVVCRFGKRNILLFSGLSTWCVVLLPWQIFPHTQGYFFLLKKEVSILDNLLIYNIQKCEMFLLFIAVCRLAAFILNKVHVTFWTAVHKSSFLWFQIDLGQDKGTFIIVVSYYDGVWYLFIARFFFSSFFRAIWHFYFIFL